MISETKLYESLLTVHFLIKSFVVPYRFDRNSKGGGLLPSKILTYTSNCNIETLLLEINLRKRK